MNMRKLKINITLTKKYKAGDVVNIRCDVNDMPEDAYWRRRLKDSEIDNCVEWVVKPKGKKSKGDASLQ